MIKILESMKRVYLFFCFVVITVCRIYAADVTYVFADAAVADGIGLKGVWTSDSIDEHTFWETKKATFGDSKWDGEGLLVYKNGKFNLYSSRVISGITLFFDNTSVVKNPNDTTFTWTANHPAILKQLEITYLTEEQDSIVDTPTKTPALLEWSMDTCEVVLEEENGFPILTTNMPNTDGVEYASSNMEVATIDKTGRITLLSAGMTTISASFAGNTDYDAAEEATFVLLVAEPPLEEEYLGIWTQVTDLSQLSIGTKIVIAASSANMALGVVQNLNNRAAVEIEKSANKDTLIINRHVQVISLEKGYNGRNWAFCVADTGYLYAASSEKNLMRTQTIVDANASWEISFSNDGVAKIQAMGSNTRRYIKYNVGYNTFSCFETGTVVLYGKDISSISTAINNAEMQVLDMKKAIRNNQVVILRNGLYYNMLGQLVE